MKVNMLKLKIDGDKLNTMEDLHRTILGQLGEDEEDYGYNLDALWDLLSSRSEDLEINMTQAKELSIKLGPDYGKVLGLFMNLALDHSNIDINLDIN